MELKPDEFRLIKETMLNAFTQSSDWDKLVLLATGKTLAQITLAPPDLDTLAERVIGHAQDKGWLFALIEQARAQSPDDPELEAIQKMLRPRLSLITKDHFDTLFLRGERVLVNREPLRTALRAFGSDVSQSILVIKGDTCTGKSYTMDVISYLEATEENIRYAPVKLKKIAVNGEVLPERLAEEIAEQMGCRELTQLQNEMAPAFIKRFFRLLAEQLEKQANDDEGRHWLVIDEFNEVTLPKESLSLIDELADRINSKWHRMRLVLINYPADLPIQTKPIVVTETLKPIDDNEMLRFFQTVYEHRKKNIAQDFEQMDIVLSAANVLGSIDRNQPRWMEAGDFNGKTFREVKRIYPNAVS